MIMYAIPCSAACSLPTAAHAVVFGEENYGYPLDKTLPDTTGKHAAARYCYCTFRVMKQTCFILDMKTAAFCSVVVYISTCHILVSLVYAHGGGRCCSAAAGVWHTRR